MDASLPSEILLLVFQNIDDPLTVLNAHAVSQRWRKLLTRNDSALFRAYDVKRDEIDARPVKSLGPYFNDWLRKWLVARTLNADLRVVDKADERAFHLNAIPSGFKKHASVAIGIAHQFGNRESEIQLRYPIVGVPYTLGRLNYSAGTVEFLKKQFLAVGRAEPVPLSSLPIVEMHDGRRKRFETIIAETNWGYICSTARENIAVCDLEFKQMHQVRLDHQERIPYSEIVVKSWCRYYNDILIVYDHARYLKRYKFTNNGRTMRGPWVRKIVYDEPTQKYLDERFTGPYENLFSHAIMGDTHIILLRSGDRFGELYTMSYEDIANESNDSKPLEWRHVLSLYPPRRWKSHPDVTWSGLFPHEHTSRFLFLKGSRIAGVLNPFTSYLVVIDMWTAKVALYICPNPGTHWYVDQDGCPFTLSKQYVESMLHDYDERGASGPVGIDLATMRLGS